MVHYLFLYKSTMQTLHSSAANPYRKQNCEMQESEQNKRSTHQLTYLNVCTVYMYIHVQIIF